MIQMSVVGQYRQEWNVATGQQLPIGNIYQSPGLFVHVQKHHPNEVAHVNDIPLVVSAPDYVGHNPKEPNSIELVKCMAGNIMVCIKLDVSSNYLFVATVFEITTAKLQKRIQSGRLTKL